MQSGLLSQTRRSSPSIGSHQPTGHLRRRCRRNIVPDRRLAPDCSLEESDYHFHRTPLNLYESYFAENQQHHCVGAARNNPGILLCKTPEPSDQDSSDDGADDVAVTDHSNDVSAGAKEAKTATFMELDHSRPPTVSIPVSLKDEDKAGHQANQGLAADTRITADSSDEDAETDSNENTEVDGEPKQPSYIPDEDMFKDSWFADCWNRPPGQMWTKDIQNQHNLRAAIRQRGFTAPRAAWLFYQLSRRKGYRFPYKKRVSLKRPEQTHGQYLSALKQRRDEEQIYENQVKAYDEENSLEECKWALNLYDMVYGLDGPEDAAGVKPSIANAVVDGDAIDADDEDREKYLSIVKAGQDALDLELPKSEIAPVVNHGITIPIPAQRASVEEMQQRNKDFRIYKARIMESARKGREEEEIREFIGSMNNPSFSNGYREVWKEPRSAATS